MSSSICTAAAAGSRAAQSGRCVASTRASRPGLTRLLAEIVLRPPDLRHFDAGLSTLATHPRGDVELRRGLDQPFTSRCPTCGRPVVVEEFIWEAGAIAPTRKVFRCTFCREPARGIEPRSAAVDDDDLRVLHETDEQPGRLGGAPRSLPGARQDEPVARRSCWPVHAAHAGRPRGHRRSARDRSARRAGQRRPQARTGPRAAGGQPAQRLSGPSRCAAHPPRPCPAAQLAPVARA